MKRNDEDFFQFEKNSKKYFFLSELYTFKRESFNLDIMSYKNL